MQISIKQVTPKVTFAELKAGDAFISTEFPDMLLVKTYTVKYGSMYVTCVQVGGSFKAHYNPRAEVQKVISIQAEV